MGVCVHVSVVACSRTKHLVQLHGVAGRPNVNVSVAPWGAEEEVASVEATFLITLRSVWMDGADCLQPGCICACCSFMLFVGLQGFVVGDIIGVVALLSLLFSASLTQIINMSPGSAPSTG